MGRMLEDLRCDKGGLMDQIRPTEGIAPAKGCQPSSLLEVKDLVMRFPITRGVVLRRKIGAVHAVEDVSFSIGQGEVLGLVGESGCGKTTVGRCVLRVYRPLSGTVRFEGRDLTHESQRRLRSIRRGMQVVFQDSYASLNPRMSVERIISEPLNIHRIGTRLERKARVSELLDLVGLEPAFGNRYPHELSGGQRQRIGLARALALNPKLIVCDEPVSALDMSVQAQIINLLQSLQRNLGLSYLFIAHDLSVVRHISDCIAVMYLGRIMEVSPAAELYENPLHPYTYMLLSAIPVPNPRVERARKRHVLEGDVPSPIHPPKGCVFHPRCFRAKDKCAEDVPRLENRPSGHQVACFFPLDGQSSEEVGP